MGTHMFREPEPRPASIVSNAFTLICLSPFLLTLVLWAKLGANISNLPLSLPAIGFHLGLGAIFCLYAMFRLQLNMFQTVKYLVVLGVVTFLCATRCSPRSPGEGRRPSESWDFFWGREALRIVDIVMTSCELLAPKLAQTPHHYTMHFH